MQRSKGTTSDSWAVAESIMESQSCRPAMPRLHKLILFGPAASKSLEILCVAKEMVGALSVYATMRNLGVSIKAGR